MAHLTWLEDAAYRRLLCLYYRKEQPIPVESTKRADWCGRYRRQSREAVATVLREFFELTDGGWVNKRCDTEIEAYRSEGTGQTERTDRRAVVRKKERNRQTQWVSVGF